MKNELSEQKLAQLVKSMRDAQKTFNRKRTPDTLNEAIYLEHKVDRHVREILKMTENNGRQTLLSFGEA